jgi:16S rRNA (cytosine967-C5)-methyltransferase
LDLERNVSGRSSQRRGQPPGLAARDLAHELIAGVLLKKRTLEQMLAETAARSETAAIEPRDRAFARLLAATVLRRQGELEHVLRAFLERGPPKASGRVWPILLAGAAQILCLGTPAHAAVGLAVEAVGREPGGGARLAGLANAVLRRVAAEGAALLERQDRVRLDIPAWLWRRWSATYGEAVARRIAEASLAEPALDIALKPGADRRTWAERLGGRVLGTGAIRLTERGRVEDLPGYAEGEWWVQGAAAALVVRAAGDVAGREVADLCAAPGGKTAALAAAGARATAVDDSPVRLERLRENLARLGLHAEVVAADVTVWAPGRTFDAVILDAPCTATGTISRHPDILRLKVPADVPRMAKVQAAMLDNAAGLVRPGGVLVYSTCSLEPEEGRAQVDRFLAREPAFVHVPIVASQIGAEPRWIVDGDVRTLPFHTAEAGPEPGAGNGTGTATAMKSEAGGLDGFYISRLQRQTRASLSTVHPRQRDR